MLVSSSALQMNFISFLLWSGTCVWVRASFTWNGAQRVYRRMYKMCNEGHTATNQSNYPSASSYTWRERERKRDAYSRTTQMKGLKLARSQIFTGKFGCNLPDKFTRARQCQSFWIVRERKKSTFTLFSIQSSQFDALTPNRELEWKSFFSR